MRLECFGTKVGSKKRKEDRAGGCLGRQSLAAGLARFGGETPDFNSFFTTDPSCGKTVGCYTSAAPRPRISLRCSEQPSVGPGFGLIAGSGRAAGFLLSGRL